MPAARRLPSPLPPPGLRGDYTGSCVACMRGTETAIAIRGPAEAAIVVLARLGVDQDVAEAMLSGSPGMVPDGDGPWGFRLCAACAAMGGGRPLPVGDPRIGVPCIVIGE